MRVKDLGNILESTGIPTAYGRFPEDQPQLPPYICYRVMRDNNFVADGTVFHKADIVQVEPIGICSVTFQVSLVIVSILTSCVPVNGLSTAIIACGRSSSIDT